MRPIRASPSSRAALHDLLRELAILVAKDGEGMHQVRHRRGRGRRERLGRARRIGLSIANSPLVKTAIAGEDANWGRIVMAVGKAGEAADRDRLSICFGDILVAEDGERAAELQRSDRGALYEGRRHRRARRRRHRQGSRHRVDLRSDARLHRYQCLLSQLSARTSIDPNFWHERWQKQEIGFHQAAVNDLLQRYWPRLGIEAGSEVFVPLCGRSLDMVWLADQGHRVIGAELSQIAIDEFFTERGFTPATSTNTSFNVKSAGPFEIWCGDFFDLPPSATAGVAGVYDRASLIAWQQGMQWRRL